MTNEFWINNPNVLLQNIDLWPISSMNKNEKFNAISRLIILLTLIGFIFSRSMPILVSGTISLAAIIFLFYLKDPKKTVKENLVSSMNYENSKPDNPMSNVLLPEIQFDPERPAAPPAYENEDKINNNTKEMVVKTSFNNEEDIKQKLFKDLGDEIEFDRSMRNFNSTASTTIPNDQDKFAEFCYGNMPSCKDGDSLACEKGAFRYIPD